MKQNQSFKSLISYDLGPKGVSGGMNASLLDITSSSLYLFTPFLYKNDQFLTKMSGFLVILWQQLLIFVLGW
jgi:hypothetical protein